MKLFNSLTRTVEPLDPVSPPKVGMYTCGMTVYDYAHIGHGRKYVTDDVLRRALTRFGYDVTHVQNVTDVGHLSSDEDEGVDKMEKGAKKTGKSVWDVALYYTDHFYRTMDALNNLRPDIICKATEHISDMVSLVSVLMGKGLAYDTPEAVYYDVSRFPPYESLFGRQKMEEKKTAARDEVREGQYKRHPADFALWFKRTGRFADHAMHWESPWGDGFPGWHIECSAMSMKYLGETIDIHTGGIDHIPVHHPNEIAQSEGATGKPFVKYWIHYNFLKVDGKKMSKSLGNFHTLDDVTAKGVDPMALRYFYLTSQYRSELNFTWDALAGAATALAELKSQVRQIKIQSHERGTLSEDKLAAVNALRKKFDDALSEDLNTPRALAAVWETVKSSIPSQDKYDLLTDFDRVLGLRLGETDAEEPDTVPDAVASLIGRRDAARVAKNFAESDRLRSEIESMGYAVEDTPEGTRVKKGHRQA